jgi:hypothetical protein
MMIKIWGLTIISFVLIFFLEKIIAHYKKSNIIDILFIFRYSLVLIVMSATLLYIQWDFILNL